MSFEAPAGENKRTQDYLPDELPAIRDLSSDFDYLLNGHENTKWRLLTALEYSDYLKTRFKSGNYSLGDYDYAKEQILPRLFLDTMTLTARREVYQTSSRARGGEATLPLVLNLINAKVDVQKDISDYVALNEATESLVLYNNLALIMHHSRRVLYGDTVTEERVKHSNLSQLSGILAEYKVLSALLEEWPLASFGSVDEDRAGTDIIVPAATKPGHGAVLQVKSSRNPNCKMEISTRDQVIPVLKVPMDTAQHDPLKLSGDHSDMLKKYIAQAPRLRLAAAA